MATFDPAHLAAQAAALHVEADALRDEATAKRSRADALDARADALDAQAHSAQAQSASSYSTPPSADPVPSPFVTTAEAAEILRCSSQHVYNLVSAGDLNRLPGDRRLLYRDEVIGYAEGAKHLALTR